jgi:hypothetical protein
MRPPHKLPLNLFSSGCACRKLERLSEQPVMNEACLICGQLVRGRAARWAA